MIGCRFVGTTARTVTKNDVIVLPYLLQEEERKPAPLDQAPALPNPMSSET